MNLCMNCQCFSPQGSVAMCTHENARDPLYGTDRKNCLEMRGNQALCGAEGRWFTAKPFPRNDQFEPPTAA